MTIAVGLLVPRTRDFVIGADSQETYDAAKLDGQKIMTLSIESRDGGPLGCVVFTGAGRAGYLDALGQAVLKTFLDSEDVDHALQVKFERTVRTFHRSQILPFGEAWAHNETLHVSTLFAYQRGNGHHGLFANDLMALRQTNCVAVGSGSIAALNYLNRFKGAVLDAEQALRLAAYAVYQAKEIDPYCGKQTHLVLLSGNRPQIVAPRIVESWESVFRHVDARTAGHQLRALGIGIPVG